MPLSLKSHKRGLVAQYIVVVLLATVSFLLIFTIIQTLTAKTDEKTAESICRGSVALREKTYTDTIAGSIASPLLCQTLDKKLPKIKDADREQLKKEIGDSLAQCWFMFGEGLIDDVFKEGDHPFEKNKCFICSHINVREVKGFERGAVIPAEELTQFLYETPYIVNEVTDNCRFDGGRCIEADSASTCDFPNAGVTYNLLEKNNRICDKKNVDGAEFSCCYTDYECWNYGGLCAGTHPGENNYRKYDEWECPKDMQCYIENENYFSYVDYIQRFGGPGNLYVLSDIKAGETYAVSFGSPNSKECSWCTNLGLTGGFLGGGLVMYATVGLTAATPVGWVALGVAGFAGGYLAFKEGTQTAAISIKELIGKRTINSVYFTTLEEIQKEDLCSFVEDVES